MPFFHKPTQTLITEGSAFTIDGTNYPSNWLNLASADEKAAHGIVEIIEDAMPTFDPLRERVVQGVLVDEGATMRRPWIKHTLADEAALANVTAAQAAAWLKIKAERDARKAGGTRVGTNWFHSDDPSRIQQLGLVIMGAGIPAGLQWKTMSNTFVTMTQTLAGQIFAATAALDGALFQAAEIHKAAMIASQRPDLYNYSTGWPERFTG